MTPEERRRIDAYTAEVAANAPPIGPATRERLRRIVSRNRKAHDDLSDSAPSVPEG